MTTTPQAGVRYTRAQRQALALLARGGARYGTRYVVMCQLRDMGLCYAHDKGEHLTKGRWTWRPTEAGRAAIAALAAARGGVG